MVGYSNSGSNLNFLVARYSTSGSLDTTFGGGLGYVTTNLGTDSVNGLVVQSNGQIRRRGTIVSGVHRCSLQFRRITGFRLRNGRNRHDRHPRRRLDPLQTP